VKDGPINIRLPESVRLCGVGRIRRWVSHSEAYPRRPDIDNILSLRQSEWANQQNGGEGLLFEVEYRLQVCPESAVVMAVENVALFETFRR